MNKKKNSQENQKSFYFEDYNYFSKNEINFKTRLNISEDRVYLLFFVFFCLISLFGIKILSTSLQDTKLKNTHNYNNSIFSPSRGEIIDKNGEILAKNIRVYHAAIKPNLIKNKKNFILKLQLLYPGIDIENIRSKLKKNKYFYLKKILLKKKKLKYGH